MAVDVDEPLLEELDFPNCLLVSAFELSLSFQLLPLLELFYNKVCSLGEILDKQLRLRFFKLVLRALLQNRDALLHL